MSFEPPGCVVWELTLACNLRCQYCGSAAGHARERELDTAEALELCAELAALGPERVSLMGGEPLLRKDWRQILGRLQELEQPCELISNGLCVDRATARELRDFEIYGLSLSLDGPEPVHDLLRGKQGSFAAVARAVEHGQEAGLPIGIVSQLSRDNLAHLDALYETLVAWQVDGWQLQLTAPLGAAEGKACAIEPHDVVGLHEWAVRKQQLGALHLYFADDIGYFHPREPALRSGRGPEGCWLGCQAGVDALGIASDGGVRGCLSLPEQFTEDSVRNRALSEIWNDPELFSYNRKGHGLGGACAECVYGTVCRGGCNSFSFAMTGHFGQMTHCWHRLRRP